MLEAEVCGSKKELIIATVNVMSIMVKIIAVCEVSLEEINKALRTKPSLALNEVRAHLLEQLTVFAHLFVDDNGANELPLLHCNLNHVINLRHENG